MKSGTNTNIVKNNTILWYIVLHIVVLCYSTGGIFSKLASKELFLSLEFCLFYGIVIMILGIYAIVWQQVLKHFTLTTAFCNKAISVIWGMVWGRLFFDESITINMIIGAVIVMIGVIMVVKADE